MQSCAPPGSFAWAVANASRMGSKRFSVVPWTIMKCPREGSNRNVHHRCEVAVVEAIPSRGRRSRGIQSRIESADRIATALGVGIVRSEHENLRARLLDEPTGIFVREQ